MKILDFWLKDEPDKVRTLLVVDGRVMCRHPSGVVGSTGWRDEAQIRAEFLANNHNVDYKWYHHCPRRQA